MTFGSLFAGIGGIDLGLERAGWVVRWQVEIDDFATRVLEHHWPDVPRHRDVRAVGKHNLEPVDLIAGGFPCQDISVAGKGGGLDGERSGLWFEYLRVVQELRPRWVLVENVPALRTRGSDTVLDGLEEAGYSAWPLVVGARHVGAPHRRDRVWIVARLGDANVGAGDWRADIAQRGEEERTAPLRSGAGFVAHREGIRRQDEGHGRDGGSRPRCDGEGGAVGHGVGLADSGEPRLAGRRGLSFGAGEEEPVLAGGGDAGDVAHGHGHGREGERRSGLLDGERTTQRHDLDGRHLWPARPGEPQHEWEEPRTVEPPLGQFPDGISGRLVGRHRRAALRGLGNSVVPQVVEVIGRAIVGAL